MTRPPADRLLGRGRCVAPTVWQTGVVHPVSTVLFIAGYGLALPLAARLPAIVAGQQRLAFAGHQLGMLVALVGWLSRGSYVMGLLHAGWLVGTRVWYGLTEGRQSRAATVISRSGR